jgi:molybdate transport system substrate-binding protein
MSVRRTFAVLALIGSLGACSNQGAGPSASASAPPSATGQTTELTIYAAASLKDALAAAKSAYEAAARGTTLTVATDSSSTLRTQIEQGAPADVFLSADQRNPQTLVDAGESDGQAVDFAGNTLTVIVPQDNPARITSPVDLVRSGVKIVAAGDDVPVTKYAVAAIAKLATLPGYPADFTTAYIANVVSREQNVKAVVAKIELGEGDAAIVYVTDAKASRSVSAVAIPDAGNVPATYAGVVVAASTKRDRAHAFLDWLAGPAGAAILAVFGFLPPP